NSIFFAPVTLSRETVRQLYGETIHTAATRLEAFGRCPFAYYMNYILGAKPRKLYEVLPSDLGKLFHDVIAEFTKKRRFDLSRAEIFAVVDEMTTEMNSEDSIFHRSARNKHILAKVRSVAAASCWAICEQIKNGQYSPSLIEHEILTSITLENGKSLSLHGRVDRVDAFEDSLKIIDYKTGGAKFSMDEALKGVQLQLMLYMNALTNSRGQKTPGGVFYFPIDDPIINTDEILSDAARDEALLKCFKMSGIEINDKFDMHSFKTFGGEIENKVKELGEKIYAGNIIAQPYTHGPKSPCKYCKFPCGGNSS
ncbi:MAG: PD-(D/E)XK nuclease family protein, partial [Clostridiales bacterium]|nr:PD-(D/E)XK nuclease family protein [Clostridiales bacterium]